ncbi:MAG: Bug family tripartite tricarboxylate transporter substrate binding protein [Lautropia sp.]
MHRRRLLTGLSAFGLAGSLPRRAAAGEAAAEAAGEADFPEPGRPIRFIVPFPPGGTSDLRARQVSAAIEQAAGWRIIVENRPGASGTIGSAAAIREAADGHTLLLGTIGTLAINPHLLPNQPYDVLRDLQPITQFSRSVSLLMAHRQAGIANLPELEQRVRAGGPLAFASTGNATIGHMVAEIYQRRAALPLTHVPYKGTAPAVQDFASGQVPLLIETPSAVWPLLQSGAAVPLAVTSASRMPRLPAVPTFVEQGYPDMVFDTWQGVVTRRGLPQSRLQTLHRRFVAALRREDVVRSHEEQANVVVAESPEAFERVIARETALWRRVVRETDAKFG